MLKIVAQWLVLIAVTTGSLAGALSWVFHKKVDRPFAAPVPAPVPGAPSPLLHGRNDVEAALKPAPRDEAIHETLRSRLSDGSGIDRAALFRLAHRQRVEVLTILTEGIEPGQEERTIERSLATLNALARLGVPMRTPFRVIELAREGSEIALETAARIGDARAVKLLRDMLRSGRTEERHKAVLLARYALSPELSGELNALARAGSIEAVQTLAYIGTGADRKMLAHLSRTSRDMNLRVWAIRALEAEAILSCSDVHCALLKLARKPRSRAPLYGWADWSLDQLVRLKMTSAIECLRRMHKGASEGTKARLLRTIYRLGGALSDEESAALEFSIE